jgi:hypothetical protein
VTLRERLLAVFQGEAPDTLPWYADLSYWRSAHQSIGDLPERYAGEAGYLQLHRDHEVGFYLAYSAPYAIHQDDASLSVTQERHGERLVTRYTSPSGTMEGEQVYLPESQTTAWTRYPVSEPRHLAIVRDFYAAREVVPAYDSWQHWDDLTGDQGLQMACIPRGGISSLLAEWCGVMNLVYVLADARAEVERTVSMMLEVNARIIDVLCDSPAPLVEFCDNLSGEVVTHLFRAYQFDFYVEQNRKLHAAGKKTLTHVDGTLRGILPLVAAAGVDAAEAVTPEPCGDVAVRDLREVAGPDLILFGGMPGALFSPPFGADDIRRQVEDIFTHHRDYNHFVIGSADQIPPDANMELVRLVGSLCEQYA